MKRGLSPVRNREPQAQAQVRLNSSFNASETPWLTSLEVETLNQGQLRVSFQELDKIERNCHQLRTRFIDPEFPPNDSSLRPRGSESALLGMSTRWHADSWKSVFAVLSHAEGKKGRDGRISVFGDKGIRSNDVEQGRLGDCWFLSAVSVVAEQASLIQRLFIRDTIGADGVCGLRLFYNGEWKVVVIDDLLPCSSSGNMLYSRVRKQSHVWVALLEKGFAKLHGSYHSLEGGHIDEALRALTGAPCIFVRPSSPSESSSQSLTSSQYDDYSNDELWMRLVSMHESRFLMGASTGLTDAGLAQQAKTFGLHTNHAYSLLRVYSGKSQERTLRLVCLRNPWGNTANWKGAWGPLDHNSWTREMQTALSYQPNDPNLASLFWMSFADFIVYFTSIVVCMYQPNWKQLTIHDTLQLSPSPDLASLALSSHMIECKVDAPSWTYITVTQPSIRGSSRGSPSSTWHSQLDMGAFIFRKTGPRWHVDDITVVQVIPFKIRESNTIDLLLNPAMGSVFIATASFIAPNSPSARTNSRSPFPCYLSLYTANNIQARSVPLDPIVFRAAAQAAIKSQGKASKLYSDSVLVTASFGHSNWLMATNMSPSRFLSIEIQFTTSDNFYFSRSAKKTLDTVPPLHNQILCIYGMAYQTGTFYSKYSYHTQQVSSDQHTPKIVSSLDIHAPTTM